MAMYFVNLAVLACFIQFAHSSLISTNQVKFDIYKICMKGKGIQTWKIVDPTSNATFYNIFNFHENPLFNNVFPIAIFVPTSVPDVQATVKCGVQSNIQLVPNSGGHSYAGLSSGNNDSIIVDFRFLNKIQINETEQSVTVESGALLGQVNAKLWQNGGWGSPFGNCMTVAIGGHAIGGGIGYFTSTYGLALDNILEIKMVDASGNAITVNPTQNTDLWWAMRGVGPGYIGLVTSLKQRIFKAADITLTLVQFQYKAEEFEKVLPAYYDWLDYVKKNFPTVFSVIFISNDNYKITYRTSIAGGIVIQLFHVQDPRTQPNNSTAFLAAYPNFFKNATGVVQVSPNYIEFVIESAYLALQSTPQPASTNLTAAQVVDQTLTFFSGLSKTMNLPLYYSSRSFYVKDRFKDFSKVQAVLNQIPTNSAGVMITSELGFPSTKSPTESAYVHRNVLFNFDFFFESPDATDVAPGLAWLANLSNVSKFMDCGQTYQNYPSLDLEDRNVYLTRFYGENLPRLKSIKRKYDPTGYFHTAMSIPIY